ncbi:uncharacterized protein [Littorina saxatilis]|uniref:Uncharacterized protein n=1 Tax=Littorina saxatilis TaxID=31220 RepID=A0AAN9BRR1_9CAEN
METSGRSALLTAIVLTCLLLVTLPPAASFSLHQSGETRCPDDWYKFVELCWTKVPEELTVSEQLASIYCQRNNAQLYLSDSAALCMNTGIQEDADKSYTSDLQMLQKRLMGNNGM